MKLVSIITPCYNAKEFLQETYECLKAQSYSNWEWIVTDDCSTDDSYEKLKQLSKEDNRIKIFQNKQNSGAAITRNTSLVQASGQFIAFLDCDDLWKKTKLEKQIELMEKDNIDFSYHSYEMIDSSGTHIKQMHPPLNTNAKEILKFNPFATSSVIIKKEVIDKGSIRFPNHLRRRQDYIFWYQSLLNSNKAIGLKEVLSSYRIVGNSSLSANKKKMALIQWQLYRNEFKLNLFASFYYFIHYAIHGVKKYFL